MPAKPKVFAPEKIAIDHDGEEYRPDSQKQEGLYYRAEDMDAYLAASTQAYADKLRKQRNKETRARHEYRRLAHEEFERGFNAGKTSKSSSTARDATPSTEVQP